MKKRMRGLVGGIDHLGKRMTEARLALSYRRRKEVTQAEVADALSVAAVTVGRWERGEKKPDLWRVPLIALALQCDPGWLAFGPPKVKVYMGEIGRAGLGLGLPERKATSRTPRGPRKQAPPATERHHTLPPIWYGYDALSDNAQREELRA